MDEFSILDGSETATQSGLEPVLDADMQPGTSRTPPGSVSAAIAAANAIGIASPGAAGVHSGVSVPGDESSRSSAGMAQPDLEAALQLLAERAQYITGASGAAIALRRDQRNDMLCRASVGTNAPGLGALLSTESGLSGESVRTRSPLRCDDTERDPRVNREGCRALGIASVAVMPIVRDDQVLGVFELFSGNAAAFGERDLVALQRLGEMVDTAVRLAETELGLPSQALPESPGGANPLVEQRTESKESLVEDDSDVPEGVVAPVVTTQSEADEAAVLEIPEPALPVAVRATERAATIPESPKLPESKKPLLWSAVGTAGSEAPNPPPPADQRHVPPVLRNLHKCWACGFPVSEGRKLCVECEEKQWRGQLRAPSAVDKAAAPTVRPEMPQAAISRQAFAAAAGALAPARAKSSPVTQTAAMPAQKISIPVSNTVSAAHVHKSTAKDSKPHRSDLPIFSGGIEPTQSWIAANKYIIGTLLIVAVVIGAIVFLR